MSFPTDRYKYYFTDNKVIAVSTYAGKTVRGVAICSPQDSFDMEKGKKLAAARCAVKIAEKRAKRAAKKVFEAGDAIKAASQHYSAMTSYMDDAMCELEDASYDLEVLTASL